MLFKPTVTTMIIFYEHDNIYVHTLLVYQKKGFDGVDMYIFCLTLKNYWWELQMHNALVWVYFWAKTKTELFQKKRNSMDISFSKNHLIKFNVRNQTFGNSALFWD